MTENRDETLLKLVNGSGFVFQLRIEHEIKVGYQDHGWELVAHEHRWKDPVSGTEGYIDIVLQAGLARMAIECKRVGGDASWVFLVADPAKSKLELACLLWVSRHPKLYGPTHPKWYLGEWHDFVVGPPFAEAAFCVVQGQSDKDRPMLERLCDIILPSVENLAEEELQLDQKVDPKIYIPVIVTNARLELCKFDPGDVDILKGVLPSAVFETVPYIGFRKGLSTKRPTQANPQNLEDANRLKERTVFVVHSTSLNEFLKTFSIKKDRRYSNSWPWEKYLSAES